MRTELALLTCSLAVSLCWSDAVNITGTVRDSSSKAGLKGAVVSLAVHGLSDTTDDSGAFTLAGELSARPRAAIVASFSAPALAAGVLRLGLAQPGRVAISGFMVDGRQGLRMERWLAAGETVLSLDGAAAGVVLYRIRAAGREFVLRQAETGEGGAARSVGGNSASGEPARLAKAAEAFSDTMVVTKRGYATKRAAVSSPTAAGIVIELTSGGNAWTTGAGTLTDPDGNTYTTVTIGRQVWMVEDLKTTRYNDGSAIPLVTDSTAWSNLTTPAYCWYGNDVSNRAPYGALYNWYAVGAGKLAPEGWHVPADSEWDTVSAYLGGDRVAGGKMKEAGTAHWASPNTGASNSSGFTALPGGYRYRDGVFYSQRNDGNWWSATESDASSAYLRRLYCDYVYLSWSSSSKRVGLSVRLVRD